MTARKPSPVRGRARATVDALPDVHLEADTRGVELHRVGVRGLSLPIQVRVGKAAQATIGKFELGVFLSAEARGAHLSRLAEAVQSRAGVWDEHAAVSLCDELRATLGARDASVRVEFPWFLAKRAPVSQARSALELRGEFSAHSFQELQARPRSRLVSTTSVTVPVTTLCPCSQAISEAGAHNQRTLVRIQSVMGKLSLDELAAAAEEASSCELYPVLKRPDEKYVTERAWSRPRFVEDVVRELVVALAEHPKADAFNVSAESQESIHAHEAYAEASGVGPLFRR